MYSESNKFWNISKTFPSCSFKRTCCFASFSLTFFISIKFVRALQWHVFENRDIWEYRLYILRYKCLRYKENVPFCQKPSHLTKLVYSVKLISYFTICKFWWCTMFWKPLLERYVSACVPARMCTTCINFFQRLLNSVR